MPIVNRTTYVIPPALLAEWQREADAAGEGTIAEIVQEDFRDEPHLYLYISRDGELIDHYLGPYCDELETRPGLLSLVPIPRGDK